MTKFDYVKQYINSLKDGDTFLCKDKFKDMSCRAYVGLFKNQGYILLADKKSGLYSKVGNIPENMEYKLLRENRNRELGISLQDQLNEIKDKYDYLRPTETDNLAKIITKVIPEIDIFKVNRLADFILEQGYSKV